MDAVINRLSQIEKTAGAILDEANVRKKEHAVRMEEKTAAFDAGLEQETAERIAGIQKKMEAEMKALLDQQAADSQVFLKELEADYESCHGTYAEALFRKLIKE